jgi:hypothetical protein
MPLPANRGSPATARESHPTTTARHPTPRPWHRPQSPPASQATATGSRNCDPLCAGESYSPPGANRNRKFVDSLLEGDGFEISVRGHGESVNPVIASFLCRPLASVGLQRSLRRPARSGRASIAVLLTPRLQLSATGEPDQAACLHRRRLSRSRLAPRTRSAARCVQARSLLPASR